MSIDYYINELDEEEIEVKEYDILSDEEIISICPNGKGEYDIVVKNKNGKKKKIMINGNKQKNELITESDDKNIIVKCKNCLSSMEQKFGNIYECGCGRTICTECMGTEEKGDIYY